MYPRIGSSTLGSPGDWRRVVRFDVLALKQIHLIFINAGCRQRKKVLIEAGSWRTFSLFYCLSALLSPFLRSDDMGLGSSYAVIYEIDRQNRANDSYNGQKSGQDRSRVQGNSCGPRSSAATGEQHYIR